MVRVEFSDDAAEWFRKAEPDVQDQLQKRLEQATDFPDHFLKPLTGSSLYRLRAGDYRAIIDWRRTMEDDDEEMLFVRRFGHRDGIYD